MAITRRRALADCVHQMQWLVGTACPDAPVVRVVLDNLNTHRTASRYETFPYETFPAALARRIAKRLEMRHTPNTPAGCIWPRLNSAR